MATGRPLLPRMHSISHCVSCGQTRPVMAGSALSLSMHCAASGTLPWDSSSMKRGMLTPTGQPAMHLGSLHSRQRSASRMATFSGRPRLTSLKLALRTRGSCSVIFCRSIWRRCLVERGTGDGIYDLRARLWNWLDGLHELHGYMGAE